MSRKAIIAFLLILCVSNCASTGKSLVWKSRHIDIRDYKMFEILPVTNATGGIISEDVLSSLTVHLRERFKAEGLQMTDSRLVRADTLVVKSEVLEYKFQYFSGPPPSSGNKSGLCIVRTHLLEKQTDSLVAEIITFNKVDVGQGMLEFKDPENFLRKSAAAITKEVVKMR